MVTRKLLVSEDDTAIATMLLELLNDEGYEVAVAYSGEQAIRLTRAFRPDVIIIGNDGRGNFEPGWCAARSLAALVPAAPLVMLSTSDAAVEEVGMTERGRLFSVALLKPFATAKFIDLIDMLCNSVVSSQ